MTSNEIKVLMLFIMADYIREGYRLGGGGALSGGISKET